MNFLRRLNDSYEDTTVPARVVCEVCREFTYAVMRPKVGAGEGRGPSFWEVRYAEHGSCAGSNAGVSNLSRLPGWHALHQCGMFCDGQDGASSRCFEQQRRGPPGIVDVIGNME